MLCLGVVRFARRVVPMLNFSGSKQDKDDVCDIENPESDPKHRAPFVEGLLKVGKMETADYSRMDDVNSNPRIVRISF